MSNIEILVSKQNFILDLLKEIEMLEYKSANQDLKYHALPVGTDEKFHSICRSTRHGCRHTATVSRAKPPAVTKSLGQGPMTIGGFAAIGDLALGTVVVRDHSRGFFSSFFLFYKF